MVISHTCSSHHASQLSSCLTPTPPLYISHLVQLSKSPTVLATIKKVKYRFSVDMNVLYQSNITLIMKKIREHSFDLIVPQFASMKHFRTNLLLPFKTRWIKNGRCKEPGYCNKPATYAEDSIADT